VGLAPASAQSLYTTAPGAFVAVGTFGLQEHSPNDVALSVEVGHRLGNGFDVSLVVRHAASRTSSFDFGTESSAWEIRPALGYHRPLGTHAALQVRGLLNVGLYDQTTGGFNFLHTAEATRYDADFSALVFGRVQLGERLTVLPGAGLYYLRTIAEDVSFSQQTFGDIWAGPAYDFGVRSSGAQFALPVSLRLGERHLVLSPTLHYALSDTNQILERVVDLSLRFNF
jgi:hypothetical protein